MAVKVRAVDDREAAFLKYVANAPTVVLECRIGQHKFPGITSDKLEIKAKLGRVQLRGYCERETEGQTCGTFQVKYLGSDGIMEGAASKYDYDSSYPLPEAMEANGRISREQRGTIRLELIRRKNMAARDSAKLRRKQRAAKSAQSY